MVFDYATKMVVETLEARQLLTATPGSIDTLFGTTGNVIGATLHGGMGGWHNSAAQSDGKIVQVGYTNNGGSADFIICRYTTTGSVDSTFGTAGVVTTDFAGHDDWAQSVTVQSDGKIVVAGQADFNDATGLIQGVGVARYNSDGSLDTTFGTGGKAMLDLIGARVSKVMVQSTGNILLCGQANNGFMVARLTGTGALDTTFGTGGATTTNLSAFSYANGMTIMNNGDILCAGEDNNGSIIQAAMVCYTPSGALDTSFNGTGKEDVALVGYGPTSFFNDVVNQNGKILCCGWANGANYGELDRFNADGTVDTTFAGSGLANFALGGGATALALQADGQIDVLGMYGGFQMARFSPSGALDTAFGTSGYTSNSSVSSTIQSSSLIITPDGKIVAGGSSSGALEEGRFNITSAPAAVANGTYSVYSQSSVSLSAAGSSDPFGEALTYAWDVNYNGTTFNPTLTGSSPTFSAVGISGPSTRNVALQVTNINGAASLLATTTLTINNVPPVVTSSISSNSVYEGTAVTVTGSATDADPTDTYTYDWHVTDSNGQVIPDGTTLNWGFTPASVGTYTATLTVSDAFGGHTSSSVNLTALHVTPTVAISGATPYANRGDLFTLNLSALEHGYETVSSWSVNWGDGNVQSITGNPSSATHTYLNAGAMTISASATDAFGTTSSNSITSATAAGIYYDLAAANHSAAASINNGTSANVVDNNGSTEWTSGNVTSSPGQWIYVDLGAAYNINDIKLNWDGAYAATYKIRISNDSCNWADLSTVQTGSNGMNDVPSLNGTGRYLLVQMFNLAPGNTGYALKDVYVYGSDDLATNRTVYGSANQSTVSNTLDYYTSTEWTSGNAANQWVFMDLGEVYNVQTVKVNFDTDLPTQYYICTSSDTTNWTPISSTMTPTNGLNTAAGLTGNGRYVLIMMPACANGTDIKISDLEVNGTYNLAQGRPETASSNTSIEQNIVDGNQSTAWSSTTTGTQSIYADMGSPFDVTRVTLNFGATNYPSAFQIQVSPNASTWTTIYSTTSFTGGTFDQGGIYGDGRYVRVYMTAGSGSNYTINEMAVYGSANLALLRPMTSSTNTANHEAPYASDQDPTTSWQSSAAGTQWLTTDMGSSFSVTNVTINFDAAYASSYTLYISSDNVNWTAMTTISGGGHTGMNQIAGLSGTGRYVKLVMTAGSSGFYQIDDLYIFGH